MKANQIFNNRESLLDVSQLLSVADFSQEFIDFYEKYDVCNINSKLYKIHIPDSNDFIYLQNFYDIPEITRLNFHFYNTDIDDVLVDNKLIIIASTSASIFICIGTKENNFGHLFIYGWDLGLIKIADNMNDFFNLLEIN